MRNTKGRVIPKTLALPGEHSRRMDHPQPALIAARGAIHAKSPQPERKPQSAPWRNGRCLTLSRPSIFSEVDTQRMKPLSCPRSGSSHSGGSRAGIRRAGNVASRKCARMSRTVTASAATAKICISLGMERGRLQQRGRDCASRPSKAPGRAGCWLRRWPQKQGVRKRTAVPSRRPWGGECSRGCLQWRPP